MIKKKRKKIRRHDPYIKGSGRHTHARVGGQIVEILFRQKHCRRCGSVFDVISLCSVIKFREAAGMTKADMGRFCGISPSYYQNVELKKEPVNWRITQAIKKAANLH